MKPGHTPRHPREIARILVALLVGTVVLTVGLSRFSTTGTAYLTHAPLFWLSGIIFAAYSIVCFRLAGIGRASTLIGLGLFGATFPIWGYLMGYFLWFLGGWFGLPHAIVTAIVLHSRTDSTGLTAASLVGVGVGLASALVVPSETSILIGWHGTMVTAMCGWSYMCSVQHWRSHALAGFCASCGYDLRGRSGLNCPECGAVTGGSTMPQPECDYCGYTLSGISAPACPECGRLHLRPSLVSPRQRP